MDLKKKLSLLEEALEVEEGTLSAEMNLEDIDEYDSMAKLSIIVMIEEEFGVKLDSATVKGFKTVQDILDYMN